MSKNYTIPLLIIGGGIGGLSTALALANKGFPVHLIERSSEFGEIGAGIQLAPNASRVLDRLGVLTEIDRYAVYPQRIVWRDIISGNHITSLDLGKKFVNTYGYPYFVIHRNDLLTTLLKACQGNELIRLETSKQVSNIEDLGDGALVVCTDGSVYKTAALVAADGLHSVTRNLLIDNSEPICSEFVAYREVMSMAQIPEKAELDNVMYWVGPNMHLVQYPLRRGELYNQVAVFKSNHYHKDSDDWGNEKELEEHFRESCDEVKKGVSRIKRDRRWPLYDRLPANNWTLNHITLLGDAAHPMLQYVAQGACQALEDALCLAEQVQNHPDNINLAFSSYQEIRFPRTARVQTSARQFGEIVHIGGMGAILRDALFSNRALDDYTYTDWLYGY